MFTLNEKIKKELHLIIKKFNFSEFYYYQKDNIVYIYFNEDIINKSDYDNAFDFLLNAEYELNNITQTNKFSILLMPDSKLKELQELKKESSQALLPSIAQLTYDKNEIFNEPITKISIKQSPNRTEHTTQSLLSSQIHYISNKLIKYMPNSATHSKKSIKQEEPCYA